MNKRFYDVAKWCVYCVCPALVSLIAGLGKLYGFDTSVIVGTIGLLTTFMGALLGADSIKYFKDKEIIKVEEE